MGVKAKVNRQRNLRKIAELPQPGDDRRPRLRTRIGIVRRDLLVNLTQFTHERSDRKTLDLQAPNLIHNESEGIGDGTRSAKRRHQETVVQQRNQHPRRFTSARKSISESVNQRTEPHRDSSGIPYQRDRIRTADTHHLRTWQSQPSAAFFRHVGKHHIELSQKLKARLQALNNMAHPLAIDPHHRPVTLTEPRNR
ncbi:hypothetical protein GCM10022254_48960 [Actinomadura meridiana]|uniref:Uncharacterized protein n=1 Tax=Actinomadura meridiana TaxID=559626 RepID=A0ABP8CBT7_9ACTN